MVSRPCFLVNRQNNFSSLDVIRIGAILNSRNTDLVCFITTVNGYTTAQTRCRKANFLSKRHVGVLAETTTREVSQAKLVSKRTAMDYTLSEHTMGSLAVAKGGNKGGHRSIRTAIVEVVYSGTRLRALA